MKLLKPLLILSAAATVTTTSAQEMIVYGVDGSETHFATKDVVRVVFAEASSAEETAGELPGLFSIAEGKQVHFSQGNLQYIGKALTPYWKFADEQYDFLGDTGQASTDASANRDLFQWGCTGYDGLNPWAADYETYYSGSTDIDGTNYDWGVYCAIQNGGNKPGLWRTLSLDEWSYVTGASYDGQTNFSHSRPNAEQKIATGTIHVDDETAINGCFLLPDEWTLPEGCTFNPGFASANLDYSKNSFTLEQWKAMEAAGAVFFPASGTRVGPYIGDLNLFADYWASTRDHYYPTNAMTFNFGGDIMWTYAYDRSMGSSVRLVKDVE